MRMFRDLLLLSKKKAIICRHKKGVRFENVKIYLFERTQGFDAVPSSGGFALGLLVIIFALYDVFGLSENYDLFGL